MAVNSSSTKICFDLVIFQDAEKKPNFFAFDFFKRLCPVKKELLGKGQSTSGGEGDAAWAIGLLLRLPLSCLCVRACGQPANRRLRWVVQAAVSGFELVGSEWEWMSGNGQKVPGRAAPAYQLLGWCPPSVP
jgi:hypothetical protein